MSELIHLRRDHSAAAHFSGREWPRLAVNAAALDWLDEASWLGDFSTPGYGFGHIKVLRKTPPPGTLGLGGDSLYFMAICDGFHHGILARPDLHIYLFAVPRGGKAKTASPPGHEKAFAEMDLLLRRENSWRHDWGQGRSPELQLAIGHIHCLEIALFAGADDEINFYFGLQQGDQRAWINLDGVPEKNFVLPSRFFTTEH